MLQKIKYLYSIAILLGISSCINSETFDTDKISEDIEIDNFGLILKLARADLTLGDIFPATSDTVQYYTDADGNERIAFYIEKDEIASYGLENIPKLQNAPSITTIVPFTGLGGSTTTNLDIPLDIDGMSVANIDGELNIEITYSDMSSAVDVTLLFSSSESKPNSFSLTIPQNSGNITKSARQKLKTNELGNIPIQISISMPAGASSTQPGKVEIRLSHTKLYSITGIINNFSTDIPNERFNLDFGQLGDFSDGIKFFEPSVILPISNNTNLSGNAAVNLSAKMSDGSTRPIEIYKPLTFESHTEEITIDPSNSNITDFADGSSIPQYIDADGKVSLHSNGAIVEMNEQSRFTIGCRIQLPLNIAINSSHNVDTLDLDNNIPNELTAATLGINSISELPVNATILLGLYDEETSTVLDYVEAGIIDAAPVNMNGIVETLIEEKKDIKLSPEELKNLKDAEKIIIRLKLLSTDYDKAQNVVLLADYKLKFDINIKGKLKLEL